MDLGARRRRRTRAHVEALTLVRAHLRACGPRVLAGSAVRCCRSRGAAATPSKVLVLPETAAALDPSSDLFKSAVEGFLCTFTLSWPLGLPDVRAVQAAALSPSPCSIGWAAISGAGAQRGGRRARAAKKKERGG